MSVHARWRWGAGALVLLAFALVSGNHLCGVALEGNSDPGMKPIGSGGLACAEFWLNRYQTLIGACAAIGAAWYAGNWVKKQIVLGRKQIAASMLPLSQNEAENFERLRRIIMSLENNVGSAAIELENIEALVLRDEAKLPNFDPNWLNLVPAMVGRLRVSSDHASRDVDKLREASLTARIPPVHRETIKDITESIIKATIFQNSLSNSICDYFDNGGVAEVRRMFDFFRSANLIEGRVYKIGSLDYAALDRISASINERIDVIYSQTSDEIVGV